MMAVEVVINCKSRQEIHPDLLKSLESQTLPYNLKIVESAISPTRLSHVQNPDSLYIFLDQDVVLPNSNFLKELTSYCDSENEKYFFTGAYLSQPEISYLAHCYNSQVNAWIQADNVHLESGICENAPGGIWIVSSKILPYLKNWEEPKFWAGEDTLTIRWLQSRGISIHYTPKADLFHYPQCGWIYFLKRAFMQGKARNQHKLVTRKLKLNWKFHLRHSVYWPGWSLHQLFVVLGSIRSLIAKARP